MTRVFIPGLAFIVRFVAGRELNGRRGFGKSVRTTLLSVLQSRRCVDHANDGKT
jgi:hypothetical protein